MNLTNLPEELKFEVLLYLNDYENNLFIYIYDTKKQKVFRKVNKQHSFFLIKFMLEFKKRYPPILIRSNDTQNDYIFNLFYCNNSIINRINFTGYYSYYTGYYSYYTGYYSYNIKWIPIILNLNVIECNEDDYNSIKYRIDFYNQLKLK